MEKELLKSLHKIGVDTRFISLAPNKIYINNLKLSRFSRGKEVDFLERFPQFEVIRSKIFQKTCTRASRYLAHNLQPQEKILLPSNEDAFNYALQVILEPYQRKYGIKIVQRDIEKSGDMKVDSIASALTLDREVLNILKLMLDGQKIELQSSEKYSNGTRIIYPLINIRESWILSWLGNSKEDLNLEYKYSEDFLKFLETFIPDIRENIHKSGLFILENGR